eukprot:TRINITY_DN4719_c0_g1_i1.p1 TRINITY_DN4719_c0_g1~~TRINITY_DN4719_c0_g1_i1.p1  ORF type:complete len:527 (-),score=148.03 TRINITY_DN4719_c0_g1_i1:85-1665(-)
MNQFEPDQWNTIAQPTYLDNFDPNLCDFTAMNLYSDPVFMNDMNMNDVNSMNTMNTMNDMNMIPDSPPSPSTTVSDIVGDSPSYDGAPVVNNGYPYGCISNTTAEFLQTPYYIPQNYQDGFIQMNGNWNDGQAMQEPVSPNNYILQTPPVSPDQSDIHPKSPATETKKRVASPSGRSSKKRKVTPTLDASQGRVKLERKELLAICSEDYENYVKELQRFKKFSDSDKKIIVEQRRKIKNRESAHESRVRKKNYIQELEQRVNELNEENSRLKENIQSMAHENVQLKGNVVYLQNVVEKSGLANMFQTGVSYMNNMKTQQANVKTGGVMLLILLLSFGVFFNPNYLKSKESNLPFQLEVPGEGTSFKEELPFKPASTTNNFIDQYSSTDILNQKTRDAFRNRSVRKTDTTQKTPVNTKQQDMYIVPNVNFKPNTTYLLCNDVQQIVPSEDMGIENDPDSPLLITFIIPPDTFETGKEPKKEEDGLLEVTCQVIDVNLSPQTPQKFKHRVAEEPGAVANEKHLSDPPM